MKHLRKESPVSKRYDCYNIYKQEPRCFVDNSPRIICEFPWNIIPKEEQLYKNNPLSASSNHLDIDYFLISAQRTVLYSSCNDVIKYDEPVKNIWMWFQADIYGQCFIRNVILKTRTSWLINDFSSKGDVTVMCILRFIHWALSKSILNSINQGNRLFIFLTKKKIQYQSAVCTHK